MMVLFHTICGLLSLLSGLGVIFLPKGTSLHKYTGRVYGLTMLTLCISSFFIYKLFGQFGAFHIMALISLLSVIGGLWLALSKRKGWLKGHYMFMLFSYVGLVMATGSHFFHPLGLLFMQMGMPTNLAWGLCAFSLWILPYLIGSRLIYRYWPHFEKEFKKNYA